MTEATAFDKGVDEVAKLWNGIVREHASTT
jgi:hypothetical protein